MFDYTKLPSPKGQVDLLETIGKGNFGFVYKARLTQTKQITAVKVVLLKVDELREILLEVEILRDCCLENKFLTRFMGCYWRNEDLWICMEFCGGGAIDSLYKNLFRNLSDDEIAIFISSSLQGLDYLHTQHHVIHRDIKSGNLLLTEDGVVKLADFGVSARTTEKLGYRAHSFIGTPYWMAPEVIISENSQHHLYDAKADIWSIGITAIELHDKNPPLSDIHPMRALKLIPLADEKTLNVKYPKKTNKAFLGFVSSCLTKDPKKRPSAKEILQHPWFTKINSISWDEWKSIARKAMEDSKTDKQKRKAGIKPPDVSVNNEEEEEDDVFQEFDSTPNNQNKAESIPPKPEQSLSSKPSGEALNKSRSSTQSSIINIRQEPPAKHSPSLVSKFTSLFKKSNDTLLVDIFQDKNETEDLLHIKDLSHLLPNNRKDDKFELVPLPLKLKIEVLSCDLVYIPAKPNTCSFEGFHFLLMGTERGLISVDVTSYFLNKSASTNYEERGEIKIIVAGVRFKQVQVLEEYNVFLAAAGKFSQVRSYSLKSIQKLLLYIYGLHSQIEGEKISPNVLINDYEKVLNTSDCHLFNVTRTIKTCYLGVLFRNDLTVYEWAKLPYLKFLKVKQFWLPETPKFFEIMIGSDEYVSDLLVGYEKEANVIEFESSKVHEIKVPKMILEGLSKEVLKDQSQWYCWSQLRGGQIGKQNSSDEHNKNISWLGTLKQMQQSVRDQLHSDWNAFATFGNRSVCVSASAGFDMTKLDYIVEALEYGGVQKLVQKNELQNLSPNKVYCYHNKYIVAVHGNYIEIYDMKTGKCEQVLKIETGGLKCYVGSGSGFGCERRLGRFIFGGWDKKKKISGLYWLKETGWDANSVEKWRKDDEELRNLRVLGTGAVVNAMI